MSVSGFDRDYAVRPGAKPLYARPTGNLAAAMIGVVAMTVLGVAAIFVKPQPTIEASADNGARGDSGDIARAPGPAPVAKQNAAFDLTAPEFAKEKKTFSSRRLEGGDAREDSLTLGEFTSGGPYLRLDIRETPADKRGNPDFFLDLTRHAAQAGLAVVKISQPSPLASRFGSFETADIRLSQKAGGESAPTERACLALRLIGGQAFGGDRRHGVRRARETARPAGARLHFGSIGLSFRMARTRRSTSSSWPRSKSAARVAAAPARPFRPTPRKTAGWTRIQCRRRSKRSQRRQNTRRRPTNAVTPALDAIAARSLSLCAAIRYCSSMSSA